MQENNGTFFSRPVTLNRHNNLLQIEEHMYILDDVEKPNVFRNMFPYEEIPKIPFNDRIVPHNMPEQIWITDTTFRDGQQSVSPFTPKQILHLFKLMSRLGGPNGLIRQSEFFLYTKNDQEALRLCQEADLPFPEITTWIRANEKDFALVKEAGVEETGILVSCSDYHIFKKLKKTRREAMEMYLATVKDAFEAGVMPRCHLEDITRAGDEGRNLSREKYIRMMASTAPEGYEHFKGELPPDSGEKKETAMKNVSQFAFLERFGQTGEYLKLELKSIMRNKAMRSRVMMSLGLIVVLTLLIAYTDVYDGRMMLNFWCFYCFALYGMTTLVKIMCPEGNYMDLLMTNRENILSLMQAKYYFHVAILLLPLLLMTPAIIAGKFPLLMLVAYMLVCSGLLYFMLFQLAVYNKQTLPLNEKITGKNSVENGMQLIIELVAMLLPMGLVLLLIIFCEEDTAYWVLIGIGLVFTLTHPLWLRNIYQRMMKRKYENLEGFHATR